MNLPNRPNLIAGAEKYYNLLHEKFSFTKKDRQATSTLERIRNYSLLMLVGYGALVLSYKSKKLISLENNEFFSVLKRSILDNEQITFITAIVIYFGIIFFTWIIEYLFDKKKEPKLLNDDLYNFCLAFDSYSKLKSYSISKREEYVKSMLPSINQYIENTSITLDVIESDPGLRFYGNPIHQLNQLERRFSWFKTTDETKLVAKAFGVLPYIITEISNKNSNWESILPLLENLLIYEYTEILTRSEISNKDEIKKLGLSALHEFGKLANEMNKFDESLNLTNPTTRFGDTIKTTFDKANKLFFSKNFFVLSLTWFVFVLLFSFAILSLLMKLTRVAIDSEILIGAFAAALGGSIMIADKVQSLRNKEQ